MTDKFKSRTIYYDEKPSEFLEKAKAWEINRCIAIGASENDELIIGGSISDLKEIQWLLHRAQLFIDEQIKAAS